MDAFSRDELRARRIILTSRAGWDWEIGQLEALTDLGAVLSSSPEVKASDLCIRKIVRHVDRPHPLNAFVSTHSSTSADPPTISTFQQSWSATP